MSQLRVLIILCLTLLFFGCLKSDVPVYQKNLEEKTVEEITSLEDRSEKYHIAENKEKQLEEALTATDLEAFIDNLELLEEREDALIQSAALE